MGGATDRGGAGARRPVAPVARSVDALRRQFGLGAADAFDALCAEYRPLWESLAAFAGAVVAKRRSGSKTTSMANSMPSSVSERDLSEAFENTGDASRVSASEKAASLLRATPDRSTTIPRTPRAGAGEDGFGFGEDKGVGHDAIDTMIATARKLFPRYRIRLISKIETHNGNLRFSWAAGGTEQAPLYLGGTDYGLLAADGRLQSVIGFVDASPVPVPA